MFKQNPLIPVGEMLYKYQVFGVPQLLNEVNYKAYTDRSEVIIPFEKLMESDIKLMPSPTTYHFNIQYGGMHIMEMKKYADIPIRKLAYIHSSVFGDDCSLYYYGVLKEDVEKMDLVLKERFESMPLIEWPIDKT